MNNFTTFRPWNLSEATNSKNYTKIESNLTLKDVEDFFSSFSPKSPAMFLWAGIDTLKFARKEFEDDQKFIEWADKYVLGTTIEGSEFIEQVRNYEI